MSASDNISPVQFMSVKELGGYQSSDYPEKSMDQVHSMIRRDMGRNDRLSYTQRTLTNSIKDEGFDPGQPVTVDPVNKIYGQGHHRFSAARSARLTQIPVVHKTLY